MHEIDKSKLFNAPSGALLEVISDYPNKTFHLLGHLTDANPFSNLRVGCLITMLSHRINFEKHYSEMLLIDKAGKTLKITHAYDWGMFFKVIE